MSHPDHVEIAANRLSTRCAHCGKSLTYKRHTHLDTWNMMLKQFTQQHRECVAKPPKEKS